MCRYRIRTFVFTADVITVVHDGLGTVYEVTGGFPFNLSAIILEVLTGDGIFVQLRQGVMFLWIIGTNSVFILRIDESTTDTRLHVDQVQLDDARDITPVLFIDPRTGTLFGGQLQIDTRGQCHLVKTGTVVAFALVE